MYCSKQSGIPLSSNRARTRHTVLASLSHSRFRRAVVLFGPGGHQFLRRNLALRRFRQFENEVDDLFLEDRGTQIVNRLGALAVEFDHLALVAGVAPRFLG